MYRYLYMYIKLLSCRLINVYLNMLMFSEMSCHLNYRIVGKCDAQYAAPYSVVTLVSLTTCIDSYYNKIFHCKSSSNMSCIIYKSSTGPASRN